MGCIDVPAYGLLCKSDLTVSVLHDADPSLWSAGALVLAIVIGMNYLTRRSMR